tara:strand:+ start:11490 stop:12035 length:546 start_codon:yes stop_codon:yes gene_type:complete
MENALHLKVKEYFWNTVRKLTNNLSNLTVTNLGNGYIKCFWEISAIDTLRIEFSKSSFYAIRLFDISNNRDKNNATCIMKEIQVNKFQSSISFPIPVNKGIYHFEFGYRKKNGEWRKLAFKELNLGYRIKKVLQNYGKDNWFNSKNRTGETELSLHEEAYQLSLHTHLGGSEKINNEKKNT